MSAEFTLTDKDCNRHPLIRLEVLEGRKSLGVYIAVNGNEKTQEAYLIEMAKKYAEQIKPANVLPVWQWTHTIPFFLKAIKELMPITNFSKTN